MAGRFTPIGEERLFVKAAIALILFSCFPFSFSVTCMYTQGSFLISVCQPSWYSLGVGGVGRGETGGDEEGM